MQRFHYWNESFTKIISSRRCLCDIKTCTWTSLPQKFKLVFLSHQEDFPIGGNISWLQSQIARILCHCIQTLFASISSPREPTQTLVCFLHPLCGPPLLNNQPLSFFSSHHVHLSQNAHGRSPIYKSICLPSFSTFHIHCTCTPLYIYTLYISMCVCTYLQSVHIFTTINRRRWSSTQ